MTGEEALVECVIRGKDVRDASWLKGAFICVSRKTPSKLVGQNEIAVPLSIFNDLNRNWEIHEDIKPKETCTFIELFDKLGPGDWATEVGACGELYLDNNGHLLLRWLGVSDHPVVSRALVNSTFIIHRAKQ